jgi:hypothetical protein
MSNNEFLFTEKLQMTKQNEMLTLYLFLVLINLKKSLVNCTKEAKER